LADFGLAILVESRDSSITLDVLTPAYAPPEMFRHSPPSPAADVYALCATLYALLRGKPARWRDDRTPSLVSLVDMFAAEIPDIPGVPEDLMQTLRLGMSNDETARPSAAQLRDALIGLPLGPGAAPIVVPTLDPVGPLRPAEAARAEADEVTEPHGPDWVLSADTAQISPTAPPVIAVGRAPGVEPEADGKPGDGVLGHGRGPWIVFSAGLVIIVGLVGVLAWYAGTAPSPNPSTSAVAEASRTPETRTTEPQTPTTPPPATASLRPCPALVISPGAQCLAKAECYDSVNVSAGVATAASLPCDQPHTWEAFVVGRLPDGMSRVDYQAVKNTSAYRLLCNPGTISVLVKGTDPGSWSVDVLPPSPQAYRNGERAFRCLAGKGHNRLTRAQFAPN
jgi:hypothetical protein